jgi:hypothetical protein
MTKREARKMMDRIRREYADQPIGDHWEGAGYYLGDGVWCDPAWIGMPGELEM